MKIGFVIDNISFHGGGQRVLSLLSNMFVQHPGLQVTIFSCFTTGSEPLAFPELNNIKIIHLAKHPVSSNWIWNAILARLAFWTYFFASVRLKKELKRHPQDVLISTCYWLNAYLPLFKLKTKLILCEHLTFQKIPFVNRVLAKLFYKFADAVVLLSRRHYEKYSFVPEEKRYVIPNPRTFYPAAAATCSPKRILVLSRFSYEKGIDILLDIASELKAKIPEWKIDLFGEGRKITEITNMIQSKKLEDFLFLHPLTDNAEQELSNSGMYFMTSRHEAFPMVILEAQSCGLPVVAFDCDYGPGDIITDSVDGILVPVGDYDSYIRAAVKLAENESLRKEIGNNARLNSEKYSKENILKLWIELFRKLHLIQ